MLKSSPKAGFSLKVMLASAVATSALLSVALPAQVIRNHDSQAPVSMNSGNLELQDRSDRVILTGGVTIQQAGLTIKSSRMTVAYSDVNGIDVDRFDAVGGVVITKEDLRATSNSAIYDLNTDLITLIGNVHLTQGKNRIDGGRLVIDLNSGRSNITGTGQAVQGENGRVSGVFTVPQRKNEADGIK